MALSSGLIDNLTNAVVGVIAASSQTIQTMFEYLRDNAAASLGGIMLIVLIGVGISKISMKGGSIRGVFGK